MKTSDWSKFFLIPGEWKEFSFQPLTKTDLPVIEYNREAIPMIYKTKRWEITNPCFEDVGFIDYGPLFSFPLETDYNFGNTQKMYDNFLRAELTPDVPKQNTHTVSAFQQKNRISNEDRFMAGITALVLDQTDFCNKCGQEVKERPLFTGTYVGCMC